MRVTKILIRLALPILAGIAAMPPAAQAQPAGDGPDGAIVVTGRQPLTEEQALEVVRRVARPIDGQLARFDDPVCPRVTGFAARYEAVVARRIKASAEAAGIRTGGEGCVSNLFVVIVDDGRGFVTELHRQHPEAFAGLPEGEFAQLASSEAAARAWSITRLTNSVGQAAGQPSPSAGGGAVKQGYGGSSVTFDGGVNVLRVYDASTINPSVQQTVGSAWVVIETGATFGKSLNQIADYSAMRGLAMVRPEELEGSEDTILDLFSAETSDHPAELTSFDRAFLKGLYRVPGRRWAHSQTRYIADAIARASEHGAP